MTIVIQLLSRLFIKYKTSSLIGKAGLFISFSIGRQDLNARVNGNHLFHYNAELTIV